MKNALTKRQKDLLLMIYEYIKNSGYPPTFQEMRENIGVSSNQSVIGLLNQLKDKGFIKRSEALARGITILPLGYGALGAPPLAPFVGATSAGVPMEAIASAGEWTELGSVAGYERLERLASEVYVLRVHGDSMINAGIEDGDSVLVKNQKEFFTGDIVLAKIGNDATVKRFISEDKPPYLYLKPENPNYEIIYFTEDVLLEGKVISVLKSGQWRPI